jgi:hypothetical protein
MVLRQPAAGNYPVVSILRRPARRRRHRRQELVATQNACARLKQSSSDRHTIARIDAAAANITDELKRRQAAKH